MRLKLVKIGNSQGIRLPKAMVERLSLHGEIKLQLCKDFAVLRFPNTKSLAGALRSNKGKGLSFNQIRKAAQANKTTIISAHNPRAGWDKAFKAVKKRGDDVQLLPELTNQWDQTEWKW
jgi:antitoxin MazE